MTMLMRPTEWVTDMQCSTWADLGIELHRASGEQRADCPHCSGRSRKTLAANADTGLFHCHRCGWSGRVGSASHWLDDHRERIRKAEQERDRAREKAAQHALALWNTAAPAMWHDYLRRKAVLPLGIRQRDGRLVVPMFDIDRRLQNCQTIDAAGNKLFLRGGRTTGLFCPNGGFEGFDGADSGASEIFIAEGFATGAALHMYFRPHAPVAVAFNCGNLAHVANALRRRYRHGRLVIAADNDQWTEGNPGLTHARRAADEVGARVIYPKFDGLDVTGKPTDFCDLHLLQREVRR